MFQFKVEILIDEEKVIADKVYEPETMYEYIKDMFRQYHLKEVETDKPNHIVFTDVGTDKDMAGLALAAIDLYDMEWFKKYAVKCLWISRNRDGSISESSVFDELKDFVVKGI